MYEDAIELPATAEMSAPPKGTLHNVQNTFNLTFKTLEIGTLMYNKVIWTFQYSNDFINQAKVKPIMGFPNVNKVYESDTLFPFFDFRIPSLKRPEIQEMIKKQKMDATNKVELLTFFGRKTITNPYVLTAIES
jgi:HipA-like protein